jgi:methionine-rich copper-binding protein CopC
MKRVVLGVLLVASLLACGTQGVTPQNNGNNGNNGGTDGGNNGDNNGGNVNTDTTAPTLTSSIPSNAATSIAVNGNIKLTFSEKMDTGSVTVSSDPNADLGSASWNSAGTQLNLDPPANLNASKTYTLSIEGKDVAGNNLSGSNTVEFTTAAEAAPADTTAPTVISSNPDGGDTNVSINSNIVITFSEPMNTGSINVSLNPNVNLGGASFKSGDRVVEFNPPSNLSGGTNYTVNVSGKDLAGNNLTGSSSYSFKTVTTADTTAPATPKNLAVIAGDTKAKLNWTANAESDLKGYTIYYGTVDLTSKVFVDKSNSSQDLIGLVNDAEHSFQIEAEDSAGNRSARSGIVKATPKSTTPPRLTGTIPFIRATNVPLNQDRIRFIFDKPIKQDNFRVKCVGLEGAKGIPQCNADVASLLGPPTWSAAGLTVTYTLTRPLTGGVNYGFMPLGTDLSGNPLPDTRATPFDYNTQLWFTTVAAPVKQFTVNVPMYGSGHVLRECVAVPRLLSISCDDTAYTRETVVRVGTRNNLYGSNSKGYYAFNLSVIPANAGIVSAQLQIGLSGTRGSPSAVLSTLFLERVQPLQTTTTYQLGGDRGDYKLPGLACVGCPLALGTASVNIDVATFVGADQTERRSFSQFRLRYAKEINDSGAGSGVPTADHYADFAKNATLTVTYRIP